MTNTESRIAIEHQELARWDDADALDKAEQQITVADTRELVAYDFEPDKQTLVGLGPVERAWRSRNGAEIPDSQRAPQSESPGPFIAEDEMPASLRGRKLGRWAVAAPALLIVGVAAVVGLRGLAPGAPGASAASQPTGAVVAQPTQEPSPPPAAEVPAPPAEVPAPPAEVPAPPAELAARVENASVPDATVSTERARATAPAVAAALPVNLPDLSPPAVVDMSGSKDANVGSLNVTSNPPANVVLDGRPLGKSPRIVKVPAGLHTVVFIHPLYGRQSLTVNVGAGATTGASADF
jgi:hypothetical protein